MNLQTLLGETPKSRFVEEYFHRLPFSGSQTAGPLSELTTWPALEAILQSEAADLMVVRDGRRSDAPRPRSAGEAQGLVAEGHTILVRHAERHSAAIEALAGAFARDFAAEVDVHIYVTPPGRHGFSWHYDAEDVFIIQTGGEKEYSLRKNTVNPWPLVETLPEDMKYEREIMPLMRVALGAGDWLYIPCGYWHKAEALACDEPAISLAVGVLSPSGITLLDALRPRLLDSLRWRARLPVRGDAASHSPDELLAAYREAADALAEDLQKALRDERFLKRYVTEQHGEN